jgi:membrane protease YdiL (CAAX protease family)
MDDTKSIIGHVNGTILILAVLVVTAVEIPFRALPRYDFVSPLVILGLARLTEGALIMGAVFMKEHRLNMLGLSSGTFFSGLWRGSIWCAGFGGLVLMVFLAFQVMGIDPLPLFARHSSIDPSNILLLILVGGIISPLTEELFFRGVLYGFLRRWGVLPAVVMSSLAFVLAHMTFTEYLFIQLTGGVLFAVAYEVEKNLMVPVTLHMAGNTALFALSFLKG